MDLEKRIIDLETKFSYQDELVYELNKIVAKQADTIEKLIKEIKTLSESRDNSGPTENIMNERPPHY